MTVTHHKEGKLIHIKGLVQGVGFRPFIYVLAQRYNIKGWVENRNDGVRIHAEGKDKHLNSFYNAIQDEAPRASNIFEIKVEEHKVEDFRDFQSGHGDALLHPGGAIIDSRQDMAMQINQEITR